MLCTFKGRKALWTKRNKADFGEFITVDQPGCLRINFGLFVKTKDGSTVVHFPDLFPLKPWDGIVADISRDKIPYVPLFDIRSPTGIIFHENRYFASLSLDYWSGGSRNLKVAIKALQGFIDGLGELENEKLCEILTGVEKAYAA